MTLADLTELQPDLAKGLSKLLAFEGDVEATFCATFTLTYECFGEMRTVELKPEGAEIAVTQENREEYVGLYVNYVLGVGVEQQFRSFARGFSKVCAVGMAITFVSNVCHILHKIMLM